MNLDTNHKMDFRNEDDVVNLFDINESARPNRSLINRYRRNRPLVSGIPSLLIQKTSVTGLMVFKIE